MYHGRLSGLTMNKFKQTAFTIVELLVAIGLLVAILMFSIVIFRVAIQSQQKAVATGEFLRTITAITTRLEQDFSSLDVDAPFAIWFDKDGSDRVFFFTSGRFGRLSSGNIDAGQVSYNYGALLYATAGSSQLLREFTPTDRYQDIITPSVTLGNERDSLINEINSAISYNPDNPATYGLLLNDQVAKFKVQILYGSNDGTIRWYPDDKPYSQIPDYSDFNLMSDRFVTFFNIAAPREAFFYPPQELRIRLINANYNLDNVINFDAVYKPLALKFIITLTENGKLDDKVFTYIVKFGI